MAFQWTSNAQQVAPSAAAGATVTPSGSAWTSGAWTTLVASTSAAAVLSGVIPRHATLANTGWEIDIGVGAAGSEVVIATVKGHTGVFIALWDPPGNGLHFPIVIDAIPNGSRIAARIRLSNTDTNTWNVAITYFLKPLVGNVQTTTQPTKVHPSAALLTSTTYGVGAWTNGAWVELVASLSTDIVIVSAIMKGNFNGIVFEVDFGTGAAGAEVVQATFKGRNDGPTGAAPPTQFLPAPIDRFASGSRLAVRSRASGTLGGTVEVGFTYYEKPL